jgi:hypothetical protein
MIYLAEHEIGFDAGEIGFPSISGCRAIVLVTDGGLFGYHLAGKMKQIRMDNLLHFVDHHPQGGSPKKNLYVACMAPAGGSAADWAYQEARFIANRLGYYGTMYYASCDKYVGSVYVHFQDLNHATCIISARQWDRGVDGQDANKVNYVAGPNRGIAEGRAPSKMFNNQDLAQLKVIYPTKIPPGKPPKLEDISKF